LKKLISIALCAALCLISFSAVAAPAFSERVAPLLKELDIMQGDPDGNLRLSDYVSRAECTKMAVAASAFRDTIAIGSKTAPFSDVPANHWAAPYITVAVKNGLCKGYLDATFRPGNTILYEEALTMFLRVLGYSEEDFGASWPDGQIGIAKNIGLCDDLYKQQGDTMTRKDIMTVAYNLLNTPAKGSQSDYLASFHRTLTDDVVLIATNREDSSVGAGKVATSAGTFKITEDFVYEDVGKKGSISLRNGDTVVAFLPNDQTVESYTVTDTLGNDIFYGDSILDVDEGTTVYYKSKAYTYDSITPEIDEGDICKVFKDSSGSLDYILFSSGAKSADLTNTKTKRCVVYSVLGDSVITYNNGAFDKVDFSAGTVFYEDDQPTSYAAITQKMAMGDILSIKFKDNGNVDYVVYEEGATQGPVTVTGGNWYEGFGKDPSSATLMRDGEKSAISDVQLHDIAYYSKDLNMFLVYSKKITGVYEDATPNKDTPSSVTVSGKTYAIEGVEAFRKLSSNGTFRFGDTVTLLLGKNGEVADVITSAQLSSEVVGYLIETGRKETTVNGTAVTKPYVRLILPTGDSVEYVTGQEYDTILNQAVRISFTNGIAKVSRVSSPSDISGTFSWSGSTRTLGTAKLHDDVKIIEVSTTTPSESGNAASVFPARLSGITIPATSVLYAGKANGKITELILKDTTGDMHDYGVVTSAKNTVAGMHVSGSYTYLLNGTEGVLVTNGKSYNISSGQAVCFKKATNGSVASITSLPQTATGTASVLSGGTVTVNGTVYKMSDRVSIYTKDASYNYSMITEEQLASALSKYTLRLYSDDSHAQGGRVRIIIASPK